MKAVMISIRPEWCEKIAYGQKTIEVRKKRPNLAPPFKCYIYCTKGDPSNAGDDFYIHDMENYRTIRGNGKVIGEFICDHIITIHVGKYGLIPISIDGIDLSNSMLSPQEIICYIGNGQTGYGWNISKLQIYEKPKSIREFTGLRKTKFGMEPVSLLRPPQSWCYVEEPEETP